MKIEHEIFNFQWHARQQRVCAAWSWMPAPVAHPFLNRTPFDYDMPAI